MSANPTTLAVPMKLDAFVLNPSVCRGGKTDDPNKTGSKIAPITQPNYTFLRLRDHAIQPDILDLHDLHNAAPASRNPRLTDLGTGKEKRYRQGVYLHWSVPRVYRSGMAATEEAPDNRDRDGINAPNDPAGDESKPDKSAPQFRLVPTRWVIIRRLHPGTAKPDDSGIPELQAWVVEGDRLRDIKNLGLDVDLQTDVSPYVTSVGDITIDRQAEVFIGQKFTADEWKEDVKTHPERHVPVSLLTSGNMLFADYQVHNSNVFSFIDNFKYKKDQKIMYLGEARASYYVVGWHSEERDDPFHGGDELAREARLQACLMQLNNPKSDIAQEWMKFSSPTEVLCHGAMYEVNWNVNEPPKVVLADIASQKLHQEQPIAVGTTPLDSVLAYIDGHREEDETMEKLLKSIRLIQTLLIDKDDSIDAQRAAEDLLSTYNYKATSGGTRWYFGGSGQEDAKKPVIPPSETMIATLDALNEIQFHLDVVLRTQQETMWQMFARWWKYVSNAKNADMEYKAAVKREVEEITKLLHLLGKIARGENEDGKGGLQGDIQYVLENGRLRGDPAGNPNEEYQFKQLVKKEVLQNYYEQLDPTVMVAGVESAWPDDFLDLLKVRPAKEITSWGDTRTKHSGIDWTGLAKSQNPAKPAILEKLPPGLQQTAQALFAEFFRFMPDSEGKVDNTKGDNTFFPQFHDQGGDQAPKTEDGAWRDRWGDTQPWFPLILEWQVEYFHVTMDPSRGLWSLEDRLSSATDTLMKLRYGITEGKRLKDENIGDKRTISGRVLILPQAGFSLQSKINDILDNTPSKILEEYLPDPKDRDLLRDELYRLKFLSAPLSGFHDNMVTKSQGSHLKPNIRRPGKALTPLGSAIDKEAGFDNEQFTWIGTETDLTPYGTLVRPGSEYSVFKPATHGQFRITKLNIIDKFGQAIHATDPRWSVKPPPAIYPYISEFYAPQFMKIGKDGDGKPIYAPNTITVDSDHPGSTYVQLPPHINQLARVNASFVTRKVGESIWKPQHEWVNPIWGWLVINYAQHGLQTFLADGRFYREIQLGGLGGTRTGEKWLPFDRPDDVTADHTRQLDSLLDKLSGEEGYNLESFVQMITESLGMGTPAPEAYAQFLNSIVGKPLALVNVGWSLELATPPYETQISGTSQVEQKPDMYLLETKVPDDQSRTYPQYTFKFKLGDQSRSYDGLVGYFNTLPTREDNGNDLDLQTLYTFFKPEEGPWTEKIASHNYPDMQAYHTPAIVLDRLGNRIPNTTTKITTQRNQMLRTFGVIMDPFTPIHIYSGILPIKELRLPTWTWQEAMSRMTAFFRVGPLLQPKDVEAFQEKYVLKSSYTLADTEIPNAEKNHKGVVVPGVQVKDGWRWLQPYVTRGEGKDGKLGDLKQAYMPLMVQPVVGVGLENGPYKALEGYLQLQKPIVRK